MRILFVPFGLPTHYYFMVPTVWAFRAAGHEVRVASQPPALDAITRSGMVAVPVGHGYDFSRGLAESRVEFRRYRERFLPGDGVTRADLARLPAPVRARLRELRMAPDLRTAEAMAPDLCRLVEQWRPDLVVADPMVLAAPLAAHAAGAPLVHHLWGLAVNRQVGFPGSGGGEEAWTGGLRALYHRYGVEARAEYAVRTLVPSPPSLEFPGIPGALQMRYVPYNGTGLLPEWLQRPAPRPRVCVTWGMTTTGMLGAKGFLVPQIISGLVDLDVEVVAAVKASDRALLGELPPGVRVAEELPLHLVLSAGDAIVHQGGGGTMLTAASFGVPQILVPGIPDQMMNASRLGALGAGVAIEPERLAAEGVKSVAALVLSDPGIRDAAERLRREIQAQPTPAEVVVTLEGLVRDGMVDACAA
jgi:glycosyltransferase